MAHKRTKVQQETFHPSALKNQKAGCGAPWPPEGEGEAQRGRNQKTESRNPQIAGTNSAQVAA